MFWLISKAEVDAIFLGADNDPLGYVPVEREGFVDESSQHERMVCPECNFNCGSHCTEPPMTTLSEQMAVARFWWAVRQELDQLGREW